MFLRRLAHSRVYATALLVALIAGAYGGSIRNALVFDDQFLMRFDRRVNDARLIPHAFVEPLWGSRPEKGRWEVHQYYRPLQVVPMAVSHALFGTAAWPTHLLNLIVHLINCVLVFDILRRLLRRTLLGLSLTALFAVYPAYSEAVLWVSDIAGIGAALCTLLVLRLHLSRFGDRWYGRLGTALIFLTGLWFKESGILAPLLVVLYDLVLAPDRGWRRCWRTRWGYAFFVPPFALYLALRTYALGGLLPGFESNPLSRTELVLNAIALLPQYARTFLWPFDLDMYHDFNAVHGIANWPVAIGVLMLAAGSVACVLTLRAHPPVAFGLLWALVSAAPHLLIRWPKLNVFAERYLYLPSVGIFLAAGYVFSKLAARRTAWERGRTCAALGVLLAAFIGTDVLRTLDWRDELGIYEKTIRQSPRAELIRNNLAVDYLDLGRYDDGIELLHGALLTDRDWPQTWYNLGLLYMAKGMTDEAVNAFEEAIHREPGKGATLLNLGYLYDRQGRRELAVEHYFRLLQLEPDSTDGWYNLAVVAFEARQLGNARAAAERLHAIAPGDAHAAPLLKRLNGVQGQHADSAETARRCAAAKSRADAGGWLDAVITLKMAAWLDEASPLPHQYLANIYYLNGRLPEAVTAQREAVQRAPDNALYRRNLATLEQALQGNEKPNRR